MKDYCTSKEMQNQFQVWMGNPATGKNAAAEMVSMFSFTCDTPAERTAIQQYNGDFPHGSAAFPDSGIYIGPITNVDAGSGN